MPGDINSNTKSYNLRKDGESDKELRERLKRELANLQGKIEDIMQENRKEPVVVDQENKGKPDVWTQELQRMEKELLRSQKAKHWEY